MKDKWGWNNVVESWICLMERVCVINLNKFSGYLQFVIYRSLKSNALCQSVFIRVNKRVFVFFFFFRICQIRTMWIQSNSHCVYIYLYIHCFKYQIHISHAYIILYEYIRFVLISHFCKYILSLNRISFITIP